MNKLILEMQVSLDGFMAGEDGGTNWMIWNWGPDWTWDEELQDYHTRLTRSAQHILLSSQMAQEGFIDHWKQAALGNSTEAGFARHITQTPKRIISSRLTRDTPIPGGWENADVRGDLVPAVRELKAHGNGDILVYGGATLVSALLRYGLIDEMHLLVNPVVIGSGLSIFKNLEAPLPLSLRKASAFACGVVVLHYHL